MAKKPMIQDRTKKPADKPVMGKPSKGKPPFPPEKVGKPKKSTIPFK